MHKVVEKHLKKLNYKNGSLSKENLKEFIDFVNTMCYEADEDRAFLEHTLETTSQEMLELYNELKVKSETALAISEAKYKELARTDTLANILNRRGFQDELTKIISLSKRAEQKFALLFLDLDHFKEINDTYGHHIGDILLQEVVGRIKSNIRVEDIFARIGGDEFVILFSNIDANMLPKLVQKSLRLFQNPWVVDGKELDVTSSIGVTIYPDDGDNRTKLLNNADHAMYKSKELGRNKVTYFQDM